MSRLVQVFQKINQKLLQEEKEEGAALYSTIIEELSRERISEDEVLRNLRGVVVAHIAAGTAIYIEHGGPEIAASGLQLQPGRELLGLLNAILEAQERILRLERVKGWKSEKSTSGSDSQVSEDSQVPSTSMKPSLMKTEKS